MDKSTETHRLTKPLSPRAARGWLRDRAGMQWPLVGLTVHPISCGAMAVFDAVEDEDAAVGLLVALRLWSSAMQRHPWQGTPVPIGQLEPVVVQGGEIDVAAQQCKSPWTSEVDQ